MERLLPYNYDGSSCFLNSLLCALFFPTKLRIMDSYILQGQRADMKNVERQNLSHVLRVVAKCIRGSRVGDTSTFTVIRPLIAQLLHSLSNVEFEHGQHDPADLFEALIRVYNVGGVFTTKKTVQSLYTNGKKTTTVTTDQMFRHTVLFSFAGGGIIRFETLFPAIETLDTGAVLDAVSEEKEDKLVKKRTIIEFGGGPVLVLTRETFTQPVNYGRWSSSTNAYLLPLLNTIEKCVQWYELQAVLCWKGFIGPAGETGHYVCFVYDDANQQWYFYNDLNLVRTPDGGRVSGLEQVLQLEAHPLYPPSETGTMFVYARVPSVPSDV